MAHGCLIDGGALALGCAQRWSLLHTQGKHGHRSISSPDLRVMLFSNSFFPIFFSRQLVRLNRLFAHSGAGLPRKLAGSTLHLVDGIRRRTVDHGDIWLEGLAEDILVQLLGTLGLGQEQEAEEGELDRVVEWHPEENILEEALDEAEAGVDHPVDEPVALLAPFLESRALKDAKAGYTNPTKLHKRPAPNPKRMNTTVTTARAAAM